jgi:ADP-sugar diphosphatase
MTARGLWARLVSPMSKAFSRQMSSSSFTLPDFPSQVPVQLCKDLSQDQLLSFPALRNWTTTLKRTLELQKEPTHQLHTKPYALRSILVQSCDFFSGGRLGFVKLKADMSNDEGDKLPGSVFLRGGSVANLPRHMEP